MQVQLSYWQTARVRVWLQVVTASEQSPTTTTRLLVDLLGEARETDLTVRGALVARVSPAWVWECVTATAQGRCSGEQGLAYGVSEGHGQEGELVAPRLLSEHRRTAQSQIPVFWGSADGKSSEKKGLLSVLGGAALNESMRARWEPACCVCVAEGGTADFGRTSGSAAGRLVGVAGGRAAWLPLTNANPAFSSDSNGLAGTGFGAAMERDCSRGAWLLCESRPDAVVDM